MFRKYVTVDIKKSKMEMAHRIKNIDIIVKFKDKILHDLVYNNKVKLKEKTTKHLRLTEESPIFINESLSFDNEELFCNVRNKGRMLGYNKIVTDNSVITIIASNQQWEPKWVRILNRKDLYKLE